MTSTWLLVIGAQRPPTPGAVAHMSLHQTNNVKDQPDSKTRTTIHPRFTPEIKAVRSYLATNSKSSRSTRGPEEPAAPCW